MADERYWYRFNGHSHTKQSLTSEGDDAYIAGIPRWPRGEVREVDAGTAALLERAYSAPRCRVFERVPDPALEARRLKAEADAKAEAERALLQSLKPTKSAARAAAKETK